MIYCDYQATTPLAPEAREEMLRWLDGPDGKIMHAAVLINGAVVMLTDERKEFGTLGPNALGGSPRATLHLARMARARAAVRGRAFVTPDDVASLAGTVLPHRLEPKGRFATVGEAYRAATEIVAEMRTLATRNSEEIRAAVEDGKRRIARLAEQGNALVLNG